MAKATQFSVGLANQPGMLAKLCGALKRAKVNIDAISVADGSDCCWVRLVASPAAKAKQALTRGRFGFSTQRVLTAAAQNRPGELEKLAGKLARAGVNVNYVYGSNAKAGPSTLVFGVNDLNRAAKALRG